MFRSQSGARRIGIAVLVLFSLLAGTGAVPHAEGPDDIACAPLVLSHDESAHVVGPAAESSDRDAAHCFLCHSLRSFHPAFDKYEQKVGASRAERMHAATVAVTDGVDWSLVPGRAPPA